jgi:outer membrane protein assembly factor BamB
VVRPERRTKTDLAVVVSLVLAVIAGAGALWWNSDARATVSETAATPLPDLAPAMAVPDRLTEQWRAASPATPEPVVAGPAVVTGSGNEVLGRDPRTGEVRWRYARDIPLCTVGQEWGMALAVHRKSHNCSEVTALKGDTGVRGPQRNSDAELGTRLIGDGTYVTATGSRVFETWRSDLVHTQKYGIPPALKNPDNKMRRPDCTFSSIMPGDDRIALVEKCPQEPGDRLTTVKARPEDHEEPEEVFTTILGSSQASVVATNKERTAVLLRDRSEVLVYNAQGNIEHRFPVRVGEPSGQGDVLVEPTYRNQQRIHWYTGRDTVALDAKTLRPLWTLPDTLGPGTSFAGKLLVPVPDGLAVVELRSGQPERIIPVDRGGHSGPVQLASTGSVVLEQRGDELVALG